MKITEYLGIMVGASLLNVSLATASSTLVAAGSGKCVDVLGQSGSPSAPIVQMGCSGAASQSFDLVPTDSGYYYIKNSNSGLCLNVNGRSVANGALVIQWKCGVAAKNDQFQLSQNPDGSSSLISRYSGLCLDIPSHSTADGTQLQQYACHGGSNQSFTLTDSGSVAPSPAPSPAPAPSPTPVIPQPTVSSAAIRVLQWNVEDGEQADEITQIVKQKPQIAFLEEVDAVAHIEAIRAKLEADQGVPFYKASVNRDGSASGASNVAILSRYPLSNVKTKVLGYEGEVICGTTSNARAAIGATISINGKPLAIFAVRTYFNSSSCVSQTQVRRLKSWANQNYSGMTQLFGGDFNMSPGSVAYSAAVDETPQLSDSWHIAVLDKTASAADSSVSFTTPTRSSRLDYLFFRNGPTTLSVLDARITTLVPSDSDHRQMITDFEVR